MKCILITGAGSGIGQGLAEGLAGEGHSIIVTDLDGSAAEAVATGITDAGGEALALTLDVTDDDSISDAFSRITRQVEVLINNAGIQHVARLEVFAQVDWDHLVDVILSGACRMTRAALPGMREAGWGRVVNVGSIHSLVASPFKSAYVAAKHGLLGFSRTIALETADTDITINTICPSYVKTPLVEKQVRLQAVEHEIPEKEVIAEIMLKPMPKGVFISTEELVGAVAFLISPAARNLTGQELVIDGGWTCR
ncbi:MAG: 3-hydroxybutyrate dehydrogenase [Verrucomicrobia bacterium]|nr:MAG: 3-hydroxybutyrate dehydrogenase [Verrucomicrobiota bacterium]